MISFFGRFPSLITSTIGGNLLGVESYLGAVVIFVAAVLICILGIIIFYKLSNKERSDKNDN